MNVATKFNMQYAILFYFIEKSLGILIFNRIFKNEINFFFFFGIGIVVQCLIIFFFNSQFDVLLWQQIEMKIYKE